MSDGSSDWCSSDLELAEGAGGRGGDDLDLAGPGEGGVRVAALGPHHLLPGLQGAALGQHRSGVDVVDAAEVEHLARQGDRELDHVGWAAAFEPLYGLADPEPRAGGPPAGPDHLGE